MSISIFEILMLLSFGAAWPVSIIKSIKTKKNGSKSFFFLIIVIFGYGMGILNKIFYNMDFVVWLYALNMIMVAIDAVLWQKNHKLEKENKENK